MTLEELEKRVEALEGLEKRVKAIEEMEEIKKLHRDYVYRLSNHQWEEMIDCFAEDATAEMPKHEEKKGKKAIADSFRNDILQEEAFQKGGHMLIQPVITVDGESAKGYWTMYRFSYDFQSPAGEHVQLFGPELQGKYDCEYVKEDGKWKFGKMKFTRPWPEKNKL
ncbi:nuclear transport factor 2 family protein [Thermodesulfobacteriota bacterium]